MYRWDHDIRPVSTVDRIRYIQNCLLLYQRGGIRALSTAPIWTEYRYLQNKSAAGLGNFDCICIPDSSVKQNVNVANDPGCVKIVHGNIHQGDEMFTDISRGRQCTCNALVALCKLRHVDLSNSMPLSTDLDHILLKGDELYHNVIMNLAYNHTLVNYYLTFEELPNLFDIDGTVYNITKLPFLCGNCCSKTSSELLGYSLTEALIKSFESASTLLLMMGGSCVAILKGSDSNYYMYDSHARNDKCHPSPYGTSIFMAFDSLSSLFETVEGLAHKICIKEKTFEILPVIIKTGQGQIQYLKNNSDVANTGYSMVQYMKDQMKKNNDIIQSNIINTESNSSSLLTNEELSSTQNVQEHFKLAKCKSGKQKEKNYNKKMRMQQKRKDIEYKAQERLHIQTKRKDVNYKDQERLHMQTKRKDVNYKDQECMHKQKKRKYVNYKDQERLHIQTKRKDVNYKDQERLHMQTKRKYVNYKDQERLHMQTKRKDVNYKDQERLHKQTKRKDVNY